MICTVVRGKQAGTKLVKNYIDTKGNANSPEHRSAGAGTHQPPVFLNTFRIYISNMTHETKNSNLVPFNDIRTIVTSH